MRKFLLFVLFLTLTPITLITSLFLLSDQTHKGVLGIATTRKEQPFAYAALPTEQNTFEGSATLADKRTPILSEFLSAYHSPLAPFAEEIIEKADANNIDYRLLPAIAMQETTLCKKTLPQAKYNCWGYGIWGKKVTSFNNFGDAIDTISRYFGKKKQQGTDTLDAIGKIYNPTNTNNWKENVALFMSQI